MARLSVVLATDTWETIRPVVERLRRQSVRQEIELVLVAPSAEAVQPVGALAPEFADVRTVCIAPGQGLASARAAGVKASSAPLVFIGETHTFAHEGWAEALVAADTGGYSAIVPALGNANARSALSWAAFLSDYGRWIEGQDAGEVAIAPIYNVAYRRDFLERLGDQLTSAFNPGEKALHLLQASGLRSYLEPSARIDHANVASPRAWLHERFLAGQMIGWDRAVRWPLTRRAVYALASPVIALVLLWRVLPCYRGAARRHRLPLGTLAALMVGYVVVAAGECSAYLGLGGADATRQMEEYELRKLRYLGRASAS